MTKRKRTVITEESHELWIIRHGKDVAHEDVGESVDVSSGALVPGNLNQMVSDSPQIDSSPLNVEDEFKG